LWHVGCFRLKFEPTTPNTSQRVAPTMLRYVTLTCCDRLAGLYVPFFQNVKMVCHGTAVGTIKDGTISCFFSEMSPTFYGIAALYSPSDFCINWRYSGKGEKKVHSVQLLTQEIKITFKAATNDLLFLVLTRLVVNLSNQGSNIFILMQMAVICNRDQFYWQDDLRKEFELKASPGIIAIS